MASARPDPERCRPGRATILASVPAFETYRGWRTWLAVAIRPEGGWVRGLVTLIREQDLKHRMEPPEQFLTRINTLCIQMTHAWHKDDGLRQRKKTLRQMDRLVGTVRNHARRYRELLDQNWQQTDWTRPQTEQVLGRMDQVLEQLPKARQQARQRILQGQLVPNQEKILSLYESDVHVIVRRKAGAEVEFGNTLLLVVRLNQGR
jgi:hypothetical protein